MELRQTRTAAVVRQRPSEIAAAAAVSTVEDKISKYYEMVGIREGACTFVFNSDGTFTSTVGAKTINGRYTMDGGEPYAEHNIRYGRAPRNRETGTQQGH